MLYDLQLALIVCGDMLLTAAAYGTSGIRISLRAALILSGIGAAALTASMLSAALLSCFIPAFWCRCAGAFILASLGMVSMLRSIARPPEESTGDSTPHFLDICRNTVNADADHSKTLSWNEAALLALALSLDSLGAGFGAGLHSAHPVRSGIFCLIIGFFCVILGHWLGRRLHRRSGINLDWLTGLLLIVLAILQVCA